MQPIRPGIQRNSDKEAKRFHSGLVSGGMSSAEALSHTREHYPNFMKEEGDEEEDEGGLKMGLIALVFVFLVVVAAATLSISLGYP